MKGIVVDINNKDAVILTEDGLFKKIENRNYEIGQTLQISPGEKTGLRRFMLKPVISSKLLTGAARIAAVIAIGTVGAFAWYTPTGYISLDVNPSVEYSVNMFDRILEVHAVNEDGEEILKDLRLENKNIGEGLKETLDELIAEGYLAGDPDSGVVIAASNEKQKEAEKMALELKAEVQTYLETRKDVTAEVDAGAASPQKVKEAKSLGVTPGKLHLVEKLQASTTGAIEMEQWLAKPVKEINKEIKKNWETAGKNAFDAAQQENNPYRKRNRDGDSDQGRNWDWEGGWTQYRKQTEKAGVKKSDNDKDSDKGSPAWETSTYQTRNRNQDKENDEKDSDENRDRNRSGGFSGSGGGSKDKEESGYPHLDQGKKRDKDRNRDQKQNEDRDRKRDQKQNEDRDRKRDQKQNEDRSRGQDWTQNQSQNLIQNRNKNWEQDWSDNWKATSGGIENGNYGDRPGGWGEPGRWNKGGDGGKDGDNRPGFRKSKD